MAAITIDVKKGDMTQEPRQAQQPLATAQQAAAEQGKPNLQNQVINTAVVGYARQAVTEGINQYAKLTGNYALANAATLATSLSSDALMIIKGGPAGLAAVGVKYALKFEQSYVEQMISDRNTNFMRSRFVSVSRRGSRYYD